LWLDPNAGLPEEQAGQTVKVTLVVSDKVKALLKQEKQTTNRKQQNQLTELKRSNECLSYHRELTSGTNENQDKYLLMRGLTRGEAVNQV